MQRSYDGVNFTTLTFVDSKSILANSVNLLDYRYIDEAPVRGIVYYRLKQVDQDGRGKLSKVISIRSELRPAMQLMALYPNPAKSTIGVLISSPITAMVSVQIADIAGRVILQQRVRLKGGPNNLSIPVSQLSAGTYLLKAISESGEVSVAKFIKN